MTRILAALALALGLALPAVAAAAEKHLVIETKSGNIVIDLLEDIAPNHVKRISRLAKEGAYNGIAFHRVLDGFMAQTGDVQFGRVGDDGSVSDKVGFGGSKYGDLKQEFTKTPMLRGMVGMARGGHSVDSANSQFFIMLEDTLWMNQGGDVRAYYTAWGRVIEGMEHVDNIKLGDQDDNGAVTDPDKMIRVYLVDAPAG